MRTILSHLNSASNAHYWANIASVCKSWAQIVAEFDIDDLSPRQLYYNSAAITRHNIVPEFRDYTLLTHNLLTAGHGSTLPMQLGWPNGRVAVREMTAKWPLTKSEKYMLWKIWLANGAFDCMRLISDQFIGKPKVKQFWCISRFRVPFGGADKTTGPIMQRLQAVHKSRVEVYRYIRIPRSVDQISLWLMFEDHRPYHETAKIDDEDMLEQVVDRLDVSAFNLILERVAHFYKSREHPVMQMFEKSNQARPRYDGWLADGIHDAGVWWHPVNAVYVAHVKESGAYDFIRGFRRVSPLAPPPWRPAPHDPFACEECMKMYMR